MHLGSTISTQTSLQPPLITKPLTRNLSRPTPLIPKHKLALLPTNHPNPLPKLKFPILPNTNSFQSGNTSLLPDLHLKQPNPRPLWDTRLVVRNTSFLNEHEPRT